MTDIEVKILSDRKVEIPLRRFGGMQGDTGYRLKLNVSEIYASDSVYRMEWYGAADSFTQTVPLEVSDGIMYAVVPEQISHAGGAAQAYLIEEKVTENKTTERICTYPIRLYFNNKPTGDNSITVGEYERNVTDMYLSIANMKKGFINQIDEATSACNAAKADYEEAKAKLTATAGIKIETFTIINEYFSQSYYSGDRIQISANLIAGGVYYQIHKTLSVNVYDALQNTVIKETEANSKYYIKVKLDGAYNDEVSLGTGSIEAVKYESEAYEETNTLSNIIGTFETDEGAKYLKDSFKPYPYSYTDQKTDGNALNIEKLSEAVKGKADADRLESFISKVNIADVVIPAGIPDKDEADKTLTFHDYALNNRCYFLRNSVADYSEFVGGADKYVHVRAEGYTADSVYWDYAELLISDNEYEDGYERYCKFRVYEDESIGFKFFCNPVFTEGLGRILFNKADKAYVDEAKAENTSAIKTNAENISRLESQNASLFDLLIKNNAQGRPISLSDHSTLPLQSMRFYGKSTQDGTPTTDEPIDIVSTSFKTVNVYGGNIFDISKFPTNVSSTCKVEANGDEITFTAKTSGAYRQVGYELRDVNLFKDKIYIGYNVVDNPKNLNQNLIFRCYDKSNNQLTNKTIWKGTVVITVPKETVKINIIFCMNMSETAAVGDTVTISNFRISNYYIDYEPYKSPATVTLSNSVILRGLPVLSGGNITIDDQQYLSDYIDIGSGKVIRNVGIIESYNGEEITTDYLSTTGELSAGATVIYALQNSIEEDLQAEDVEKLQAIQPYNPNSIIASNAEMVVNYIADTKKYIDKQYSKLATAITALGGTI